MVIIEDYLKIFPKYSCSFLSFFFAVVFILVLTHIPQVLHSWFALPKNGRVISRSTNNLYDPSLSRFVLPGFQTELIRISLNQGVIQLLCDEMGRNRGYENMVTVRLVALECIDTKVEKTEEVYLCIFINQEFFEEKNNYGEPYKMKQGQTVFLSGTYTGNHIGITLSEEEWGKDDRYGTIEIVEDEEVENADYVGGARYILDLPPQGKTRYKLHIDVLSDDGEPRIPWYNLELISIRCNDAQQYADHVYLKVNGAMVWGPRRMRTGHTLSLTDVRPVPIPHITSVQFWEEDEKHRDDFFGELMLRIGDDADFVHDQQFTFSRDRGIVGDARYTLTYRLRQYY